MLPIDEYPEAIAIAKLRLLEADQACERVQEKLEVIYIPAINPAIEGNAASGRE